MARCTAAGRREDITLPTIGMSVRDDRTMCPNMFTVQVYHKTRDLGRDRRVRHRHHPLRRFVLIFT